MPPLVVAHAGVQFEKSAAVLLGIAHAVDALTLATTIVSRRVSSAAVAE